MLLDEKLADPARHHPKYVSWTLAARYDATRFKISNEVVEQVGLLFRDFPYLLLQNFQFAIPPYPVTYVEWDAEMLINAMTLDRVYDPLDEDRYLGVICKTDGETTILTILFAGRDPTRPYLHTVGYVIGGSPLKRPKELPHMTVLELSTEIKLAFLLGSTYTHKEARISDELVDWLLHNVEIVMQTQQVVKFKKEEDIYNHLEKCGGEFRLIMAMLLWINQRHVTYYEKVPAQRRFSRGKPRAYATHNIVKLHEKKNLFKSIKQALSSRESPRLHEVRATWRTINEKPGCIHSWPMFPDEKGHFVCRICEAKVFRVRKYERGDATKGCVVKEYEV